MHAAVGTTLGGVCTLVGEPQNLLISHEGRLAFRQFFRQVAPRYPCRLKRRTKN